MGQDRGGVYLIVNTITGKVYVGSTYSFTKRKREHFGALKTNRHPSKKLQNSWNKHGASAFEFMVLEIVEDGGDLIAREQYYLDLHKTYRRDRGYNTSPSAKGGREPHFSQSERDKIAVRLKQRWQDPEYKARMAVILKASRGTVEYRAQASEVAKKRWRNGSHLEQLSEEAKRRWLDPATAHPLPRREPKGKQNRCYISFAGERALLREWAERLSMNPITLYDRIYNRKWSVEDAFSVSFTPRRRLIEYNGEFKTLTEWCALLGFRYRIMHKRIVENGEEPSVAFERGVRPQNRLLTFRGTVKTAQEWAVAMGLSARLILSRLNSLGWTVERALTEPPDLSHWVNRKRKPCE